MKKLYIQTKKIAYGKSVFNEEDNIIEYFVDTMQGKYDPDMYELTVPACSIKQTIKDLSDYSDSKMSEIITNYFPKYINMFPDYSRVCDYLKFCLESILNTADSSDNTIKLSFM